eukprot:gene13161-20322_t
MASDRRQSKDVSSYMDKAARSSMSGTSSITNRPSHMKSGRKDGAATRRPADKVDQPIRVLDPEDKNIVRTPLSLLRQPVAVSSAGAKAGGRGRDESASVLSPFSGSVTEDRSADKNSYSRLESSDSGSESSRLESSAESDEEESITGIERLALDDTAETSSMDSRLPEDRKKKKDKHSEETSDEGAAKTGKDSQDKDSRSRKAEKDEPVAGKKREMTWQERKEWREAPGTVTLSETSTFFLLDKPDEQICIGTEAHEDNLRLQTKFERYSVFCANSKGNDSGVTVWDIHDTIKQLEEEDAHEDVVGVGATEGGEGADGVKVDDGDVDDETSMIMQELDDDVGDDPTRDKHNRRKAWMTSPNVIEKLTVVERVVVNNIWHVEQLLYRNVVASAGIEHDLDMKLSATDNQPKGIERARSERDETKYGMDDERDSVEVKSSEAKIRTLWRFGCELTKDKNASCQSWNRGNSDLLAVGYGEYGIPGTESTKGRSADGMVCCWSVKNPVYPERVMHIPNAGASSLDFSHHHPSLLAVGNTDGTLALYDVRRSGSTPALKSTVQGGQHTGTIWEVKWVDKGKERHNDLVSVSADGLIKQWTFKKGLECQCTLKSLKRTQNDTHTNKGDALLSRQSGGMCLDFNPAEPIMYVVGTEDGTIHKCNTSNQEHYIQDYAGHNDPVYRVRWHPFSSDYFLSCSADWTAKLWHDKKTEPAMTFDSTPDAIHDVSWSPANACIFGAVTSTGKVEVWNITEPLEAVGSVQLEGRSLNCVLFAQQESPVLTVGDNKGDVTVVKLKGEEFEWPNKTHEEQAEHFMQ